MDKEETVKKEGEGEEGEEEHQANQAADITGTKPPMSKKQMKKQAKMERIKEYKAERKEREKKAKQEEAEKKRDERNKAFEQLTEEERSQVRKRQMDSRRERQEEAQAKKARLEEALSDERPSLVIDMDFDGKMLQGELVHCASQLGHSYSANKKVDKPLHLHFTGWKGEIKELAEHNITGILNWKVTFTNKGFVDHFGPDKKDKLVYLSSDSSEELDELVEGDIYIIGGLVDHNRHKGLCYERAEAQGIRTARLPIKKYVELADRAVLTINQCVQIMVEMYQEGATWQKVLDKVLPPRKRVDFKAEKAEKEAEKARAKEENKE
jgi:tRNA (guanine9-N1)-methyltransferase